MTIFSKIKQRFKAQWTKLPKSEHKIKYAFTVAGMDYFEMDDIFNIPYKRGLAAMSVYEELRMKCTYEFLKAHATAVNNILSGTKFNLASALELKKLNDQLLQRLSWAIDTELAYKLAAVVFFDKTENPEQYDAKYAAEKIARWKKHEGANDFFLRQPLQRLIPFLKHADTDFQTYSAVMGSLTETHLENIFSMLSPSQKKLFNAKPSKLSAGETQPK